MQAYLPGDTIAAPATAPAPSAIAMLRLSGPDAHRIARAIASGLPDVLEAQRAYVRDLRLDSAAGALTERCVATLWQAPHSYTGEDMAELCIHGNPHLLDALLAACLAKGARLALPGEFTQRAVLCGKLDLAQAEAVAELIGAGSLRALRLASAGLAGAVSSRVRGWVERLTTLLAGIEVIHDYAADDLDASLDKASLLDSPKLAAALSALSAEIASALEASRRSMPLRYGITVAVCGLPNAGKSTLFNALLGYERAITSPMPGTTRDYLAESLEAGGVKLTLVDTAGWRETTDALEAAGVARSGEWAHSADRLLWVCDASALAKDVLANADTLRGAALASLPRSLADLDPLIVLNKCDLLGQWPDIAQLHCVSSTAGTGIRELWAALAGLPLLLGEPALDSFNARQADCAQRALDALAEAGQASASGVPLDAVAMHLYSARLELRGVYETEAREDVISAIFSGFCVGK